MMETQSSVENELFVRGRLSVVICNYNYEQFVAQAIESALALDWQDVEVIVVDDGSTDQSPGIIQAYAPRGVRVFLKDNRGQASAAEEGYQHSSGEWILFLDSDDSLHSSLVKEAAQAMKPGWSMIQFQMSVVDEIGRATGSVFPKYKKDIGPERIRRWMSTTDSYPTPPTSGNLLSRRFLAKIFPLEKNMDPAIDSYFLATAPLLGDVITVSKPLVSYRVHRSNDGAQQKLDMARISRDFGRHIARCNYATRTAARWGIEVPPDRWRYGYYNLAMRLASLRLLAAEHPLPYDSLGSCLADAGRSMFRSQGLTPLRHLAMTLWLLVIGLSPIFVARNLISWRFAPPTRPRFIQRFIQSS
jgi:glycosyltransferase involved in cell wall biosynthesis